MKTRHLILITICAWAFQLGTYAQERPAQLWVQFEDRFLENEVIDLTDVDSIGFSQSGYRLYQYLPARDRVRTVSKDYRKKGIYRFD